MIYFFMFINISVIQTVVGVVHTQLIIVKKGRHHSPFRSSCGAIGVWMIHQAVLLFIDAK